ncbi:MAG: hypothetical protein KGI38_01505 [Thaumarchaeota archaeon]|nr:hypothetical protein [Nitrososphaerota archaeon]
MKTNVIATSAIVAFIALGAAAVTFAHSGFLLGTGTSSAQTTSVTTTQTGEHEDDQGENDNGGNFNLTVGTTLTFSNLDGHWVAFSNMSEHEDDSEGSPMAHGVGNSTGSFSFKVTGHSGDGYNLTITSGTFTINGTTYAVTSGHLTLNEGGESGFGNGTASGGATFEIHVAGIHGNTTSAAQVGAIKLDVQVGKSAYLVILGSNEGVEESDSD